MAFVVVAVLTWLVRVDGWTVQTVASGSMAPTIPTGSVILSRPVAASAVAVGDVIVFVSPVGGTVQAGADGVFEASEPMLITHRVIAVGTDGSAPAFRTKGDANEAEDPWLVPADAVQARYVAHVPYLGSLLASAHLRRALYLTIALAGLVVIVAESRSIAAELRRRGRHAGSPSPTPGPSRRSSSAPARHRR